MTEKVNALAVSCRSMASSKRRKKTGRLNVQMQTATWTLVAIQANFREYEGRLKACAGVHSNLRYRVCEASTQQGFKFKIHLGMSHQLDVACLRRLNHRLQTRDR